MKMWVSRFPAGEKYLSRGGVRARRDTYVQEKNRNERTSLPTSHRYHALLKNAKCLRDTAIITRRGKIKAQEIIRRLHFCGSCCSRQLRGQENWASLADRHASGSEREKLLRTIFLLWLTCLCIGDQITFQAGCSAPFSPAHTANIHYWLSLNITYLASYCFIFLCGT